MKETRFEKKLRKQAEKDAKKQETNKAEYKVVLVEKLGGTVRVIKSFYAQRYIDLEDHVVYLKNDKLKFMEIFPQQINDFKNYKSKLNSCHYQRNRSGHLRWFQTNSGYSLLIH